ncbi:hypothetical protein [Enterococcus sp. LJL90]
MDKKVFTLMKQRYGKFVLIAGLLIVLFYIFSATNFIGNWQSNHEYYFSKDFSEYYLPSDNIETIFDEQGNILSEEPTSLEDYRNQQLYVFEKSNSSSYSDKLYEKNYQSGGQYYYNAFRPLELNGMIFLALGFLLFFVDLKTSFNTFLFSSGISRKKIFMGKLLAVALPILFVFIVATLIQLAIISLNIPDPYFNSELGPLLSSLISTWALAFLNLIMGIFVGILTGNLILGPLTVLVYGTMFLGIPELLNNLQRLIYGVTEVTPIDFSSYFNFGLAKQTNPVLLPVVLIIVGCLFIFLAVKAFQKVSLENNGHFLLVPKWRLPIFIFMALYANLIVSFLIAPPLLNYQYTVAFYEANASLLPYVVQLLIQLVIVTLICGLLVYSDTLIQRLQERREKKFARLG